MKLSKPVQKWIISVGELVLGVAVVAFIIIMLRNNIHPSSSLQDYLLIFVGLLFGVAIAAYLLLLGLADLPSNESSLINQVYDLDHDGPLNWNGRLAVFIGDIIREDKRLMKQVEASAKNPKNAPLLKEVLKKADKEKSRRQREIMLRYALMTLDARDQMLIKAKKMAGNKKAKR